VQGCRSGIRSKLATADLLAAGFKNVTNLDGGYLSLLRTTATSNQRHQYPSSLPA
jgi:rhodanese-related sulfurtransferase